MKKANTNVSKPMKSLKIVPVIMPLVMKAVLKISVKFYQNKANDVKNNF